LIDPETGRITQVRAFTSGKNINPRWTPDGRALLFLSDRDGIPNLYRVGIGNGDVVQLTRVGTGLSGITSTSPALSVAAKTGSAAFSVYADGKYSIHLLDESARPGQTAAVESGETAGAPLSATSAATLPPVDRVASDVAQLLDSPDFGLPPAVPDETQPYRAKLSLEGIAQPSVAVGASQFGAALGGGVGFQFGDLLGDHTLTAAVQVQTGLPARSV
jgi:WD40-like Beta Propeller Repeat